MRGLLVVVSLACLAGCDGRGSLPKTAKEAQPPDQIDSFQQRQKEDLRPAIQLADLLDALGMKVWKAAVNQRGRDLVNTVSFCVKAKGSVPRQIVSADLTQGGSSPGELLVFLQQLEGRRYKLGLVYHAGNGRSTYTTDFVDDPFTEVVGVDTSNDADVGGVGIIPLVVSASVRSKNDIENDTESVAIYLKNQ